jgi:pyruvate dehydrogenase E1 component
MNDDADPAETGEWLDALKAVELHRGQERANLLVNRLVDQARRDGLYIPRSLTTAYKNTIPPEQEAKAPGDRAIEHRLRSIIRWNALAIILRANKDSSELGGHIASFQSAATLYDIGFGHFWHAPTEQHGGDLLFIQGHSSPGIYARAFLEGRLTEEQLLSYRQETAGKGLSSYPHPWLMPDFWQFPTVSMGLGPLMAIYQARFLKYLQGRGLAETDAAQGLGLHGRRRDGRARVAGRDLAGRPRALDNLIFVINCNLQRLDGPVRGNGKIVQELESVFRGAGWNVIKVLWGGGWDALLRQGQERQAAAAHGGMRRRRVPGLQEQERRLRARALLRQATRKPRRSSPT